MNRRSPRSLPGWDGRPHRGWRWPLVNDQTRPPARDGSRQGPPVPARSAAQRILAAALEASTTGGGTRVGIDRSPRPGRMRLRGASVRPRAQTPVAGRMPRKRQDLRMADGPVATEQAQANLAKARALYFGEGPGPQRRTDRETLAEVLLSWVETGPPRANRRLVAGVVSVQCHHHTCSPPVPDKGGPPTRRGNRAPGLPSHRRHTSILCPAGAPAGQRYASGGLQRPCPGLTAARPAALRRPSLPSDHVIRNPYDACGLSPTTLWGE